MTTPNLAKIERVDLREAWPNEARDFTPWLAENIDELGEALGMDLELQQTEAAVGDYSLDVLATDLNQNRTVIIENQLEVTNHDHLGKLLTYAAGYDANVIVWLTREFRDEHRAALDWLNQRTGEDTQFFGVVVELWKIGNSLPAPHFSLAAAPNGWRKMQVRPTAPSSLQKQNYEWRRGLIENLRERCGFSLGSKFESNANWLITEQPMPGVWYYAIWFRADEGKPGFELTAEKKGSEGRDWNQRLFKSLERHREEIEAKLAGLGQNEWFAWEPVVTQGSRVAIFRDGNVFEETERWEEFREWIIAKAILFRDVFAPYLKEFSLQEQQTIE